MAPKRAADVTLSLFWDTRWKRWTATIVYRDGRSFRRIETTSEVGQVESNLLLDAVRREMESWLA